MLSNHGRFSGFSYWTPSTPWYIGQLETKLLSSSSSRPFLLTLEGLFGAKAFKMLIGLIDYADLSLCLLCPK